MQARTRNAVIVPTTLPLPDVLAQLVAAEDEMALVIEEYGGSGCPDGGHHLPW